MTGNASTLDRPKQGGPVGPPFFVLRGYAMDKQDGFFLSVTLSAADLAHLRRRVVYLEAALVQVLRDDRRIKEWFSAAELVTLRLPGLPASRAAVTRLARSAGWIMRAISCQGGQRHEYHFTSLPRRAFDALIAMVVAPRPDRATVEQVPEIPAPPAPRPPPENTAPPWLLPLMRAVRSEAPATVREAMALLPRYLPMGMALPTEDEVLPELQRLGMLQ